MIIEWLWGVGAGIATWMLSLFDGLEVPAWFDVFADVFASVIASGVGMGAWIPWTELFLMVSAVLGIWFTLFGVKALRWLVGWVPTMGGS